MLEPHEGGGSCPGRRSPFIALPGRAERRRLTQPGKPVAQDLHRLAVDSGTTQGAAAPDRVEIRLVQSVWQEEVVARKQQPPAAAGRRLFFVKKLPFNFSGAACRPRPPPPGRTMPASTVPERERSGPGFPR